VAHHLAFSPVGALRNFISSKPSLLAVNSHAGLYFFFFIFFFRLTLQIQVISFLAQIAAERKTHWLRDCMTCDAIRKDGVCGN